MRRATPRRSEQNQLLDEEIGKIPELQILNVAALRLRFYLTRASELM
jgi:hypothetical protein